MVSAPHTQPIQSKLTTLPLLCKPSNPNPHLSNYTSSANPHQTSQTPNPSSSSLLTPLPQTVTPPPPQNLSQTQMEEEKEEEDVPTERIVEHGVLRYPKTMAFKARKEKRYILSCLVDLRKCSISIRKMNPPGLYQHVVVLVPTMFTHYWTQRESMRNNQSPTSSHERGASNRNTSMNMIIWNCQGASSAEFRRAFRAILDYHRPRIVALLETKMEDHHILVHDFGYSSLIQMPANGNSGGIVLMWNNGDTIVDQIGGTDQEIHAMVKVR
ncbi:hypothetical protein A4A49_57266, partial [Nicotiana attenuata]